MIWSLTKLQINANTIELVLLKIISVKGTIRANLFLYAIFTNISILRVKDVSKYIVLMASTEVKDFSSVWMFLNAMWDIISIEKQNFVS